MKSAAIKKPCTANLICTIGYAVAIPSRIGRRRIRCKETDRNRTPNTV